jgi:hypothetical protein
LSQFMVADGYCRLPCFRLTCPFGQVAGEGLSCHRRLSFSRF